MRRIRVKTVWKITAVAALCAAPIAVDQSAAADDGEQATASQEDIARVAAVQAHVDAYRSGDLDAFVATFTPDAQVFANNERATGHQEIRALYALNFAPGAPRLRIHETWINDGLVYLTIGYVFESGEEMCCSYSEYEVRDGKISYLATSG